MKPLYNKYKLELLGAGAGVVSGWAYWFFIGCESGSCSITSSPVNSSIYGLLMGALLSGTFKTEKQKKCDNEKT